MSLDPGSNSPSPAEPPTHAGGVVYRRKGDRLEYLLVQAKRAPEHWVLPKGHIEAGEPAEEAALREVREESGVLARLEGILPQTAFVAEGSTIRIQFYLMQAVGETESNEARQFVWLPWRQAVDRATHPESKALLRAGEAERRRRSGRP